MRVKVGDTWYGTETGAVMVQLTDQDKKNIHNMLDHCDRYCDYNDELINGGILDWMNEGYDPSWKGSN